MGRQAFKSIPQLRTKDIFQIELSPLFIICRFIGLFSYDKNMTISLLRLGISLVIHIIYTGLVVYLLYQGTLIMYRIEAPFADVQVTTYALCHGLNLFLTLSHIIMMIIKKQAFQEVINMLLYMDTLWSQHSSLYSKKCTTSGIFILILFYILVPIVFRIKGSYVALCTVGFCYTEMFFFFIAMQFCSILDIIRKHLEELREDLRDDEIHLVHSIAKHQTLLRFCPAVNEAYSWQILVMCLKFFVFGLMVAYLIILDNQVFLPNIFRLSVLIWEFALLFPISRTCSEIEEEADNFNNKLFNLMRESKDLCSNDKLHLYVTMKQSVNFTACGFFTLGYPLVTSIIAAATTYLVILVQFSMPS